MRIKPLAILISAVFLVFGCVLLSCADATELSDEARSKSPSVNEDMFIALPLEQSDPVPDIKIQPFSVSNATVYDLMRAILEKTGVSFSVDAGHPDPNVPQRLVSATNVSGPLKNVLEMFGDSTGFDYYYVGGILHITANRQYIVRIPPGNGLSGKDLLDSLPPMLNTLGATDVYIDKISSAVTYRATKPSRGKIDTYLKLFREQLIDKPASTTPLEIPKIEQQLNTANALAPQEPWLVTQGALLRETLHEWSLKSGWSLIWGLSDQDDYRLETGNSYQGNFKEAINGLINSLPLTVHIHAELRSDNTPPLLYITREEGAPQ